MNIEVLGVKEGTLSSRSLSQGTATILLFALLSFSILSCEKEEIKEESLNDTLVWRGMYHEWEINHRVNRMGDWVHRIEPAEDGIRAYLFHSAASGSASDRLAYSSFFTRIKTNDIGFLPGIVRSRLWGKEGTSVRDTLSLSISLPAGMRGYSRYDLLLNGFDMYPTQPGEELFIRGDGGADKLFHFEVSFSEVVPNPTGNSIDVDMYVTFGADCSSLECINGPGQNQFDYQLSIAYQLLAFHEEAARVTTASYDHEYEWFRPEAPGQENDPNEIFRDDLRLKDQTIQGEGGGTFRDAVLGFRSFRFKLDKGSGGLNGGAIEYQHLLALDWAVLPLEYKSEEGSYSFDLDLFFKNWTSPIPFYTYGASGRARIGCDVSLLQIDEAVINEEMVLTDEIRWNTSPLENAPPNNAKSLSKTVLFLD